jgi:hypothetical protein
MKKIKKLSVKIDKIDGQVGTVVYMTYGDQTKYFAFEKEIDYETMQFFQEGMNHLFYSFFVKPYNSKKKPLSPLEQARLSKRNLT